MLFPIVGGLERQVPFVGGCVVSRTGTRRLLVFVVVALNRRGRRPVWLLADVSILVALPIPECRLFRPRQATHPPVPW